MIFHATLLLVKNIKCDLHLTINKDTFSKSTVLSSLSRCISACRHNSVRNSFVGKRSCVGFCKKKKFVGFCKNSVDLLWRGWHLSPFSGLQIFLNIFSKAQNGFPEWIWKYEIKLIFLQICACHYSSAMIFFLLKCDSMINISSNVW